MHICYINLLHTSSQKEHLKNTPPTGGSHGGLHISRLQATFMLYLGSTSIVD